MQQAIIPDQWRRQQLHCFALVLFETSAQRHKLKLLVSAELFSQVSYNIKEAPDHYKITHDSTNLNQSWTLLKCLSPV